MFQESESEADVLYLHFRAPGKGELLITDGKKTEQNIFIGMLADVARTNFLLE